MPSGSHSAPRGDTSRASAFLQSVCVHLSESIAKLHSEHTDGVRLGIGKHHKRPDIRPYPQALAHVDAKPTANAHRRIREAASLPGTPQQVYPPDPAVAHKTPAFDPRPNSRSLLPGPNCTPTGPSSAGLARSNEVRYMPPPMAAYDPLRRRKNVDEDTAADAERIDTGTAIEVGAFPDEARASPAPSTCLLGIAAGDAAYRDRRWRRRRKITHCAG